MNKAKKATSSRQIRAIRMIQRGHSKLEISEEIGVSRQLIYEWEKKFIANGRVHIEPIRGRPAALRKSDIRVLRRLLRQPPHRYGIDAEKWKLSLIAELIEKKFGFILSISSISRTLQKSDITYNISIFDQSKTRTKRTANKKSTKPMTAPDQRSAWSLLSILISNAAAADGFTLRELEEKFDIGDGTGRVWRSWQNGERVAKQETRDSILEESLKLGWIRFGKEHRHTEHTTLIPSEIIQSALGQKFILSDEDLAVPPHEMLHGIHRNARSIVAMLLKYLISQRAEVALDNKIMRLEKSSETDPNPYIRERDTERLNQMLVWRKFVIAIEPLFNDVMNLDLFRAQLVTAYRRKGYE